MRLTALIFLLSAAALSCRTVKEYVPVDRIVRETITVRDTVVQVRIARTRDSVTVILGRDTASYLENPYAFSRAEVSGGALTHVLGSREADIAVKTQYVERLRTDSIPYAVEVPGPVVTVRAPSFGQALGFIAAGIALAFIGLFIYRLSK